jgi:fatty acyl-CoA reductase
MDKDSAAMRRSNIVQEFHGAHVLVTGGTGFMGHVLMEKLLRSCQIGKLYIIARPKKGLTGVERCQQIFGEPVSLFLVLM